MEENKTPMTTKEPPTTFGSVREVIGDACSALEISIEMLERLTGRLLGMTLETPQHIREVPLRTMAMCCAEKAEFIRNALDAILKEIDG